MKQELKKSKVGRKWFDGKDEKEIVAKLKNAWGWGCNDKEAADWAEVSEFSVSRYLKTNSDLKEIRNRLVNYPIIKAKQTVREKLEESYQNAMDYLKRKKRDEFSDNVDLTSGGDKIKNSYDELSTEELIKLARSRERDSEKISGEKET